jgi:hypothetical protein
MTTDQYKVLADQIWKINQKNACQVAEIVFKHHVNNIPPIVKSLPGMEAFLTELQKASFMHGCMAAIYIAENGNVAMEPVTIQ